MIEEHSGSSVDLSREHKCQRNALGIGADDEAHVGEGVLGLSVLSQYTWGNFVHLGTARSMSEQARVALSE